MSGIAPIEWDRTVPQVRARSLGANLGGGRSFLFRDAVVLCDKWDCHYSTCFVMFSSTPTHIRVTNSDDPP